jgi:hypothetical protein
MKPGTLRTGRVLLSLLIIIVTVGLVSWDHKQSPGRYGQSVNDTTPKTFEKKEIRNLDEALEELNKGEWKEDLEKAMKELKIAMKNIDGDKIKFELEKSMKDVDFEKLQKELSLSLKEIDLTKLQEELKSSLKEIDLSKLQVELKESLAKVDWDKMKVELDKVKNIDMKELELEMSKVKEQLKDLKPQLEKELGKAKIQIENAREDIEKAKVEIKEYKDFVDGLERDGLIQKDKYELKHQQGELLINGKKASDQTYSKYRSFLEKHKRFTIEKSNDNFNIDMD